MFPRAVTLTAMCLAVVMVQLDTTVVNLALPLIQQGLHTDVATLQWVIDAYNLVYATLIVVLASFALTATAVAESKSTEARSLDPPGQLTMMFGWYSFIFIVPNYLQTVLKLSALTAGLLLIPNGVLFAGLAPFAGHWMAKTGARRLIVAGMTTQALGFLTTLALGMNGPVWLVLVQTTLLGVALALEGGPLMAVAMRSVPKDRYGMPSGIVNVTRITGATIGVAVQGSIFATHAGGAMPDPARFVTGMHVAMLVAACVTFLAVGVAFISIERPAAERLLKRQVWIGAER